jgi:fatty acid desaturase
LLTETLDNDAKSFCWSKLGSKYANAIMTAINSPIRRTIPPFERSTLIQTPLLVIWVRLSMKYISRNVTIILFWSLPPAIFVLTAFVLTGKKKNMKDH